MGHDLLKYHLDGKNGKISSSEISSSSYLLLSDEIFNSKIHKYPQQDLFGFRIVGMQKYDPCHLNSEDNEMFGRELDTKEKFSYTLK